MHRPNFNNVLKPRTLPNCKDPSKKKFYTNEKNLFPLGADPINWVNKGKRKSWSVVKRLGLVDTPSLPKELKKGRL
jgi:hypothetical protein